MLTARAEHRLRLRADNAETRLGAVGEAAGCIGEARRAHLADRGARRAELDAIFAVPRTAHELGRAGAPVAQDGARRSAFEWLRFPGVSIAHLGIETEADPALLAELVEDARYAPYLERQASEQAATM